MKRAKLDRLLSVLRSAAKTKHITRFMHDPGDDSIIFYINGTMYEIQWDDNEYDFEMIRYQDRRTFVRLGLVDSLKLSDVIY